jgi:hypothetical protein
MAVGSVGSTVAAIAKPGNVQVPSRARKRVVDFIVVGCIAGPNVGPLTRKTPALCS